MRGALVTAGIAAASLLSAEALAQRAQRDMHFPVGVEFLAPADGETRDSQLSLGAYAGAAFSLVPELSLGVAGAFDGLSGRECAFALSGGAGYGADLCPLYRPYRVMGEIELRPLPHQHTGRPFLAASGGSFGEVGGVVHDPIAPAVAFAGGLRFFASRAFTIDLALRFVYVAFRKDMYGFQEFSRPWVGMSLGVTPWLSL